MALPGDVLALGSGHDYTCEWDQSWVGDGQGEECSCSKPAEMRLQGETDSFGAEYSYFCMEHLDAVQARLAAEGTAGHCDWCKKEVEERRPHRDIDEGSHGPVYDLCNDCIRKDHKRLQEELDSYSEDEY